MTKNAVKKSYWQTRNKLDLGILLFLLLIIVIGITAIRPLKPVKRLPEAYPILPTDEYVAYFEMETSKTGICANEEFDINIYLTTTGEPFYDAGVILEWDPYVYKFVSNLDTDMVGDEEALESFVGGNQGRRALLQFVPKTTPPLESMTTTRGQRTLFYTVTLRALVDNPTSGINFSQGTNDLHIQFDYYGDTVVNRIDQTKADQTKQAVSFTPKSCVAPSPSYNPSPSPSQMPGVSPSVTPSPGVAASPSVNPSPSSSPQQGTTTFNFQLKLDGVPANDNNMNLPQQHFGQTAKIVLENQNGLYYYLGSEGLLTISYNSNTKLFNASLAFSPTQLPSGSYNFLVKGPSHRQIRFCQNSQAFDYVCRRGEYLTITSGQTYNYNFSPHTLEFGDVNWDSSVGVNDYSEIKACKWADARMGDTNYETGCKRSDGNLDGVVDITDIDLFFKTISHKPDDE